MVPSCGFSAATLHCSAAYVSMSYSFLEQVSKLSEIPKHKGIERYKSTTQETLSTAPDGYKHQFLDTNFNKKQQNLDLCANQDARTKELQATKQLCPIGAFATPESLEKDQNRDAKASHLGMQRVPSNNLNCSPCPTTTLFFW